MLPIQTKTMTEKEDHLRKNNIEGNSKEGGNNNDNLDVFENEDDNEVRAEVPIDKIKMLKSRIEGRDEELIRQRKLIVIMLK
jgi:hypothetical protein